MRQVPPGEIRLNHTLVLQEIDEEKRILTLLQSRREIKKKNGWGKKGNENRQRTFGITNLPNVNVAYS